MKFDLKIIDKGHTYIDKFCLKTTTAHPDFFDYYRLREKNPSIKYTKYKKKYGEDLLRFFEIAYKILKEEEDNFNMPEHK